MNCVQVSLPVALLEAAGVNPDDFSSESAKLLALELYRENKISLGRAAEPWRGLSVLKCFKILKASW